jgi:hypothetical protein
MHINYSDVIVQLPKTVDAEARRRLARKLKSERGVTQADASPRARQLMIVHYDPQVISALGVLRTVHAQGIHARLIGM